jgi:hypothetical protein
MYSFTDSFPGFDPANYARPLEVPLNPWEGEAEREFYDEMYGPGPATLADAHSHWHAVHGWNTVCDLDCGAGEAYDEFDDDAAEYWQTYGEPEAREEMSAQEYNLFENGFDPPF